MRSSPRRLDPSSNMGIARGKGRLSMRCAACSAGLVAQLPTSFKRFFAAFWDSPDFLELALSVLSPSLQLLLSLCAALFSRVPRRLRAGNTVGRREHFLDNP